jgi:L-fuconolactonase
MTSFKRIDAHHHFWRYTPEKFPWITPERMVVGRDFLPDEFAGVLSDNDISGSVVIQNFRTLEETDWLLGFAREFSWIKGVVGWFPLTDPGIEEILTRYSADPLIVGAREILQLPDVSPLFDDPAFHRGLDILAKHQLPYDLLIGPWHFAESIQLADAHPNLTVVLSHLGKPPIAGEDLSDWMARFREIAKRPNVVCKLSGLPLESKIPGWQESDFQPCIDLALECFGPDRLMFGSDWPPCLMATSYSRWVAAVEAAVAPLSTNGQSAIWYRTAERVYGFGS